jgi:hypothetical protein
MTTTESQKALQNNIRRAKDELEYLTKFVNEFEKNTPKDADWGWVGDWNALAKDVSEVADRAERMARNSRKVTAK